MLAVALEPVVVFVSEFGSILGDLAALLADTLGQLPALLADVMPMLGGVVEFFVSAMRRVVEAIRFAADVVRDLLGIPRRAARPQVESTFKPDAEKGLAFREASRGGIDDFINKAQQAAFSAGGGKEEPAKQTATATQQINNKFDGLIGEIKGVREFVQKIYDRIPGREAVTSAAGDLVAGMTGGGILNRMITG
jgi:hypothetical protein